MDNTLIQKLKDAISKSQSIGIVVGTQPSVDDMAAVLSLYLLLKQTNKSLSIASPAKPLVEHSSLIGINKVKSSLGGGGNDLVVSFPYVEGEIEKVSYTLEEGHLNIIVKAAEKGLSFDEKDVQYTRSGGGSVDLLFVIGTPQIAQISSLLDPQKSGSIKIVNIDNKRENQGFGDILFVSPEFSSVSEQIAEFAFSLGLRIDQDTAQNMMSGIIAATNNFQDPRTSSLALEMGGLLMKRGAKRIAPTISPENRAQGQALTDAAAAHLQQQQRQFGLVQPAPQKQQQPAPLPSTPQPAQNLVVNGAQTQPEDAPPVDWLEPKVYKGSSNF